MTEKPVLLVTGGSRGIGRSIVDFFAAHGWAVAACATCEDNLAQSRADFIFGCDVRDARAVKEKIGQVAEQYGRIDALINNAGIAGTNPLSPVSDDDMWHDIMDVDLNGVYYFSKYIQPHLPDEQGRIINIASVLALKGVPDQVAYCSAKHGVIGLTRSLALYLAPRRITVNAICPGWVDTDMAKGRFQALNKTQEQVEKTIPLGRIISPGEIASLAFYLVSPAAMNITGQAIVIDGGAVL